VTKRLRIPTIGIGAGAGCDGQVQVFHDLLGLFEGFVPKHTKQYANAGQLIRNALTSYAADVREGRFPTDEQSFSMDERALAELKTSDDTPAPRNGKSVHRSLHSSIPSLP
jgi:3-methyl-2-oxobutanoate hydroxymethyltransferase